MLTNMFNKAEGANEGILCMTEKCHNFDIKSLNSNRKTLKTT